MSKAMFERQLKWRREKDAKVEKLRTQLASEGKLSMDHKIAGATVGEHVEAYREYNKLVGEADGGKLLKESEYRALQARAAEAAKNRLFVFWRNPDGLDCYTVGPDSRCFCGHSYKSHAWYETETKEVHCRVPGCECAQFTYLCGHGSQWPKCECKHTHDEHRLAGRDVGCSKCDCKCYRPPMSCACGFPLAEHATVFESRRERRGRRNTNLCGGGGLGTAAAGGVTRLTSLVHGRDREIVERKLPYTDSLPEACEVSPGPKELVRFPPRVRPGTGRTRGRAVSGCAQPIREGAVSK